MTHCDIVPVLRPFLWWTDYITVLLTAPKRSITRPGLSSPIQSSRHSGNNVVCPRSTPSSRKSRKNLRENPRESKQAIRFYKGWVMNDPFVMVRNVRLSPNSDPTAALCQVA